MTLDDTFTKLAAFLNSLDAEGEQKFELSHSLVIICPDCGKNIAFRGRCPKCASNSWIPAGHAGGIFERMKAQRLRDMITSPDDTASMRSTAVVEPPAQDRTSFVADQAAAAAAVAPLPAPELSPEIPAAAASVDLTSDEFAEDDEVVPEGEASDSTPGAPKRPRRRRR